MPRRPSRRHRTILFAVLTLLAPTACSAGGQGPVTASPAADASSTACKRVAQAWPSTVGGLGPHDVSTTSTTVHAWGKDADTAVIARCGVTSPGPTTDTCFSADGVDWVQIPLADGNRFVTYGRAPAIEVLVPKSSGLDGTALAAFTDAARAVPQGSHRCS